MSDAVCGLTRILPHGFDALMVNGFQDWNWRRFCCSSIASENRGADTKVQIAATETLREIFAVTRKKITLNFLFTAANKLSFVQCRREIYRILFGNIVPVTFIQNFLATTICWAYSPFVAH